MDATTDKKHGIAWRKVPSPSTDLGEGYGNGTRSTVDLWVVEGSGSYASGRADDTSGHGRERSDGSDASGSGSGQT